MTNLLALIRGYRFGLVQVFIGDECVHDYEGYQKIRAGDRDWVTVHVLEDGRHQRYLYPASKVTEVRWW